MKALFDALCQHPAGPDFLGYLNAITKDYTILVSHHQRVDSVQVAVGLTVDPSFAREFLNPREYEDYLSIIAKVRDAILQQANNTTGYKIWSAIKNS